MKVYNLTDQTLHYAGRAIPPYGFEDIDVQFIPNRDLELQKKGVLSFGSLPIGWSRPQPKPDPIPTPDEVIIPVSIPRELPVAHEVLPPAKEEIEVTEKVDTSFKSKKR